VEAVEEGSTQATEHSLVVSAEELLVKLVQPVFMALNIAVEVAPNLQVAQEAKMVEQQVQEL
jgi:hypothetical protein